ncbi:MAG: hypothetical protein QME42_01075 [bacterium]|nr:hypothetical protein [bacterium]
MSLVVSLRVPDGIVVAADSLMTFHTQAVPKEEFVRCPKCEAKIPHSLISPPPPVLTPGSPNVQKLFCVKKRDIGLAVFGMPFLTGRTIENHLRDLEKRIFENETVERVAAKVEEYFRAELNKEVGNLENIPENQFPLGFQLSGYDEQDVSIGKTFSIELGRTSRIEPLHSKGYGCSISGDQRVVLKLWKEDPNIPLPMPPFQLLPLQDAIDYTIFLIDTTIKFQRFTPMTPTCGGSIDVSVITYHSGFQWIKKKELVL